MKTRVRGTTLKQADNATKMQGATRSLKRWKRLQKEPERRDKPVVPFRSPGRSVGQATVEPGDWEPFTIQVGQCYEFIFYCMLQCCRFIWMAYNFLFPPRSYFIITLFRKSRVRTKSKGPSDGLNNHGLVAKVSLQSCGVVLRMMGPIRPYLPGMLCLNEYLWLSTPRYEEGSSQMIRDSKIIHGDGNDYCILPIRIHNTESYNKCLH